MAQTKFVENLARIIGQIRFRPTIPSLHGTSEIATELESEFEEWRTEKTEDIALYSPSQKKFLQIASDVTTYVNEQDKNLDEATKYLNAVMDKNVNKFSVKEIRRVGFRITLVLGTPFNYSDLVDLVFKKFYTSSDALKSISSDKNRDVVFVLDGEKNGFYNHVQMGPVNQNDAIKFFNSHFPVDKEALNSASLFMDIDVFTTQRLSKDTVQETLNKAIGENNRIVSEYLSYLSS